MALIAAALGSASVFADTVILKQGARPIEGSIVKETDDTVVIQTTHSVFPLKKSLIQEIIRSSSEGEEERRGDLELRRNNLAEAYEGYKLALAADPTSERIKEKLESVSQALLKEEQKEYALRIDDAEKDAAEKRFPSALAKLRAILAEVEEGPFRQQVVRKLAQAHFDYAQNLKDTVQLESARDQLRKSIKEDPGFRLAYLDLADLLDDDPRTGEEARALYTKGFAIGDVDFDPSEEAAYRYSWALLQFDAAEYEAAMANFRRVVELSGDKGVNITLDCPRAVECLVASAHHLAETRETEAVQASIDALKSVIEHIPSAHTARELLGRIYADQGRHDEAVATFTELLSLDARRRGVHQMLAKCHLAQGDMAGYQASLRAELAVNSLNYDAAVELGGYLLDGADYSDALKYFDQAIGINDVPAAAHIGRIDALVKLERLDEAREASQALLDRSPTSPNPGALSAMGRVLFAAKDYEGANDTFFQVIDLLEEPDEESGAKKVLSDDDIALLALVREQIGKVAMALDNPHQAQESFERAIALKPDYAPAYNGLGKAFEAQGRLEEAEEGFLSAVERDPTESEYVLNLGILHHRQYKKPGDAIPFYLHYLELGGRDRENVTRYILECGGDPNAKSGLDQASLRSMIRQRRIRSGLAVQGTIAKERSEDAARAEELANGDPDGAVDDAEGEGASSEPSS